MKNIFTLAIVVCLFISSCSLEKRHYSKGYNIEWNHRKHVELVKLEPKNTIQLVPKTTKYQSNTASTNKPERKIFNSPVFPYLKSTLKSNKNLSKLFQQNNIIAKGNQQPHDSGTINDEPKKTEGLGLAGFIIGILGLLVPAIIGFFLCIIAVIFSAISLDKFKQYPEEYKGKGFAITGLILGIIGTVLCLILLAGLLVL